MTDDQTILYFIKFFQQEEYADEFVKGKLYLNRLSYFKKVEAIYDTERSDANEAVAMWFQPRGFYMTINNPMFGRIEITEKDLAAPTSISFDHHDHYHVLCLHAITVNGFECVDGKFHLSEGQVDELHRQLRIDPRCFRFGRFAVIVAARPFVERITRYCAAKIVRWRAILFTTTTTAPSMVKFLAIASCFGNKRGSPISANIESASSPSCWEMMHCLLTLAILAICAAAQCLIS